MKKALVVLIYLVNILYSDNVFGQKIYELSNYGLNPDNKQNSSPILKDALKNILEEANKLNSDIIIQFKAGEYNFYEKGSFIRECYISNHDQNNPKKIGIVLDSVKNITIDGNGAKLIFHGRMLPISILNSKNCTLKNFSIDFKNPHISQIKILENSPDKGIVFEPAQWVKHRITKDSLFETFGEGWRMCHSVGIAFNGDTKHLVYNTSDITFTTKGVKKIANKKYLAPNWKDKRLVPGTIVAMRGEERPSPGIFLSNNFNTILENIKIHYAEGMGLLAQLCENVTLNNFNVCLKGLNDERFFTTQADATHFSGCKGKIISCNGLYEGMMDDAINVHGTYLKVIKKIDSKTLVGKYMHNQSWGFEWGRPLDTVQFIRSSTMELVGKKNIIDTIIPYDKNVISGAKEFKIIFKDTINENISDKEIFGMENLTYTPQVYFANNIIRNNRARGALFSTPRLTIIENNLFDHTSGTAILLCGDCNGWYETGACENVVIRKNKFINALTNLFQFTNAIISIYPVIPDIKNQNKYFHKNITIEDNIFETFDFPIIYAKSVNGLIFRKNIIKYNNSYKPFHFNKSKFKFEKVTNIEIED